MLTLRRATESDLGAVAEIHVESWRAAYRGIVPDSILEDLSVEDRVATWHDWYSHPGSEVWLALRSDRPVAFSRLLTASAANRGRAGAAEITHLYVLSNAVGGGFGRALFTQMVAEARVKGFGSIELWVLEANERARRFYERFGLRPDGARQSRPKWLGDGVYEVHYTLSLE